MTLKPGLYIVSTPIGNLGDITLRALDVLRSSSIVFCEDTRVSRKLLAKHNITGPQLNKYNDHSNENTRFYIQKMIEEGGVISLISDAGTPLISDPGYKLVRHLKDQGCHVDVIPGVSSPVTALTLSGFPTDRFLFAGFIPRTVSATKQLLKELSSISATLIFFETSPRLLKSLEAIDEVLGAREVCVTRELTKLYQEAKTGSAASLIDYYKEHKAKGEIVLVISGAVKKDEQVSEADLTIYLSKLLKDGISAKTVTETAYKEFGLTYSKSEIYKLVNQLKAR